MERRFAARPYTAHRAATARAAALAGYRRHSGEQAPARPRSFGTGMRLGLLIGLLPVLFVASSIAVYLNVFSDRIYPGIRVGDVAIGALTREEAHQALARYTSALARGEVRLLDGDRELRATAGDIGVTVPDDEVRRVVDRAWQVGRTGGLREWARAQVALLRGGASLSMRLSLSAERGRWTLRTLAQQFDRPAVAAHLDFDVRDTDVRVHVVPEQTGRRLNVDATLRALEQSLAGGVPRALSLVAEDVEPAVRAADAAAASALASRILSTPLTFDRPDGRSWTLTPLHLNGIFIRSGSAAPTGERRPGILDEERIRFLIADVARQADEVGEPSRLELRGGSAVLVAGRAGWVTDQDAAVADAVKYFTGQADTPTIRLKPAATAARSGPDAAALAATRDWVNARLALPLRLTHDDKTLTLDRSALASLVAFAHPAFDAPAGGAAASGNATAAGTATAAGSAPAAMLEPARVLELLQARVPAWIGLDAAQAALDPALELRGGRVAVRPGRAGAGVDYARLVEEVVAAFAATDEPSRTVAVRVARQEPRTTERRLEEARAAVQRLVGRPVAVVSMVGDWTLRPEDLFGMVTLQPGAATAGQYLRRDRLVEKIEAIARDAERRAAAMGLFDEAGRPWRVDVAATTAGLLAQLDAEDRIVDLAWTNLRAAS